jgi:hypothetical protein
MGYDIELSFNILKHGNVSELQNKIKEIANESECNFYFENYEFENNVQFKRTHSLITINFNDNSCGELIYFVKQIKKINGIHFESIYDDNTGTLLFASSFYLSQMMNTHLAKKYKVNKRTRSYSEDDIKILNELKKKK